MAKKTGSKKTGSKKERTKEKDYTKSSPVPPAFIPYLLILLVGILCYSNTLHGPFVFDDRPNIVEEKGIHLDSFSSSKLADLWHTIQKSGRPVAQVSLAINYYFGGLNTFGYHLVNVFIHLLCAIFFYLFIELTLNLPNIQERYGEYAREIALAGSLLFVAHPIQTQAVSYIVQRVTPLAALFFLMTLYFYGKARLAEGKERKIYFTGSVLAALLALGSKQNSITLPFYVVLYEYYFLQRIKLTRKKWFYIIIGLVLVVGLVSAIYTGFDFTQWLSKGYKQRSFTPGQRMLTQLRVVIFYISLLLAPLISRLNLAHHFTLSYSLFNPPTTFLCLVLVLGLIILSIYTARKHPLVSFAIILFWGNLLLESSLLPLEMIFEHRVYLPSTGFFLLVSAFLVKRIDKRRVGIKTGVLLVLIIPLSILTYQRNKVWQDKITLWEDAAAKSPHKPRATYNLGKAYDDKGLLAEAEAQYRRTIETDTAFRGAHNNLGKIYLRHKKNEQAQVQFLEEIKHHPDNAGAYYNLGKAYKNQGYLEKAIIQYRHTLKINPLFRNARNNLGNVYLRQNKLDQAIAEYFKEIKHFDNARAYYNLANAYRMQGFLEKAVIQYKRSLEVDPTLKGPHNNLGSIYFQQGKTEQAVAEFLEGIRRHSDNAFAYQNLGNIYVSQGLPEKAIIQYQRALKIDPGLKSARKSLERAYARLGKPG